MKRPELSGSRLMSKLLSSQDVINENEIASLKFLSAIFYSIICIIESKIYWNEGYNS